MWFVIRFSRSRKLFWLSLLFGNLWHPFGWKIPFSLFRTRVATTLDNGRNFLYKQTAVKVKYTIHSDMNVNVFVNIELTKYLDTIQFKMFVNIGLKPYALYNLKIHWPLCWFEQIKTVLWCNHYLGICLISH